MVGRPRDHARPAEDQSRGGVRTRCQSQAPGAGRGRGGRVARRRRAAPEPIPPAAKSTGAPRPTGTVPPTARTSAAPARLAPAQGRPAVLAGAGRMPLLSSAAELEVALDATAPLARRGGGCRPGGHRCLMATRSARLGLGLRGGTQIALEAKETGRQKIDGDTMKRSLEVLRRRVDQLGVAEPTLQRSGDRRIIVELPGSPRGDRRRSHLRTGRRSSRDCRWIPPAPPGRQAAGGSQGADPSG